MDLELGYYPGALCGWWWNHPHTHVGDDHGVQYARAIGTSVTVVIFTALGGVVSYIINGWNVSGLPPYSVGYVNLLNLIILIIATVPMAQVGVKASHDPQPRN